MVFKSFSNYFNNYFMIVTSRKIIRKNLNYNPKNRYASRRKLAKVIKYIHYIYFLTKMTKKQMRKTGEFIPRYFGLKLAMPSYINDIFVHPAAYVLGQIMLEAPSEIRARVRDWTERNNKNYEKTLESLVKNVKKRENTKNLLNYSRRTEIRQEHNITLTDMSHMGGRFTGQTKSKGRGSSYTFSLPDPLKKRTINIGHPGARDTSPDNVWSDVKGKDVTYMTLHLAIPEIALIHDHQTGMPQRRNITGLAPKDRDLFHCFGIGNSQNHQSKASFLFCHC